MEASAFENVARRIPHYGELLLRLAPEIKEQTFDIHLKSTQPISLCGREGMFFLREDGTLSRAITKDLLRVSSGELQEIFMEACAHSVFSHEQEIRKGYISLGDACRVGVCGTAVSEQNELKSVREITSLTFRVPREARGCADRLFLEGGDLRGGALFVGEPSSGKTTLLRDTAYSLSTGKFQPVRRVAVLDGSGEIGGGFDLGPCADVLQGYPKKRAFDIAIRMLSPEYIICDELSWEDLDIVRQTVFSGVSLIASVHGTRKDMEKRPVCKALLETGAFGVTAYLFGRTQPGEISFIETEKGDGEPGEAAGSGFDIA